MATIKIVLRKNKQRKDGKMPLALRITQNRVRRFKFLGQYILEKDWDADMQRARKSHPNSVRLNNLLLKELKEANDVILEADTNNKAISSTEIKKKVSRKGSHTSFFHVAAERVKDKYDQGTFSVAKSELSILYNIEEFLNLNRSQDTQIVIEAIKERRKERIRKGLKSQTVIIDGVKAFKQKRTLYFTDIDSAFIKRYKSFCAVYLKQKTRTITNQLIFIRTLFNLAIKEGIIDRKYYPFAGDKEKITITSGNKIGLTKEEVERIEALECQPHTPIWHTRNVWLFAFYFAGIRISDVLEMKWSDFKDDRLFYQMNKNEKPVSLKIPDKAKAIIAHYRTKAQKRSDYIFPYLKKANPRSKRDIYIKRRNATKLLNKYLKRIALACDIDKNLSNHIARHSFGNIAGDAINPLMLQKLYRHSDLKTTINYQANFIHKDADDALDAVINF